MSSNLLCSSVTMGSGPASLISTGRPVERAWSTMARTSSSCRSSRSTRSRRPPSSPGAGWAKAAAETANTATPARSGAQGPKRFIARPYRAPEMMAVWALRFLAQASSSSPGSIGRSLP